jgi:hypothetical protein
VILLVTANGWAIESVVQGILTELSRTASRNNVVPFRPQSFTTQLLGPRRHIGDNVRITRYPGARNGGFLPLLS